MAKDDFHVIVYQILAYLYNCLKNGEKVNSEKLSKDSEFFIANGRSLDERYWGYILFQMQQMRLIEGIEFSGRIDNYSFQKPLRYANCMITPLGIEYLTDNSFLNKAKEFLKDTKAIIPFV